MPIYARRAFDNKTSTRVHSSVRVHTIMYAFASKNSLDTTNGLVPRRVTADLLTSRGREAARCAKRLSKAPDLSLGVRATAARLLRAWRGVVDADKKTNSGGEDDGPEKQKQGGVVKDNDRRGNEEQALRAVAPATMTAEASDKNAPSSNNSDNNISEERSPAPPAPLARPSLVPDTLWERLSREFNHSQLRAVWAATASARETCEEQQRERARKAADPGRSVIGAAGGAGISFGRERAEGGVILLQGPPGTGKTRTVLGVVSAILARRKENATTGGGGQGSGTTLAVGSRQQKRPGAAGRWAAVKTHQRVSTEPNVREMFVIFNVFGLMSLFNVFIRFLFRLPPPTLTLHSRARTCLDVASRSVP